jgi:hypothetical protein
MTTLEIITLDVDQCKESLASRSDVYNSKRVHIDVKIWLKAIYVCIKGLPVKEFGLDASTPEIVNYINDNTI